MAEWTLSVAELNEYVRKKLAGDPMLREVRVRGEISGFKRHVSGHLYFTLKDENARVSCAMFRSQAAGLDFAPADGQQVVVTGEASLYAVSGTYQLYVSGMRRDGQGDLHERFERLKRRLAAEGLFDPSIKKPLPLMPGTIGVVTSRVGAAFRDIVRVARERNPKINILIAPCAVQGAGAAEEIARAICALNEDGRADVILAGRGGGSIEDLWAFNEEIVARAIAASRIPVISCVGHEIDFTIADFVADQRAATPSNAAEIAVPDVRKLADGLKHLKRRLDLSLEAQLQKKRLRLMKAGKSAYLTMPRQMLVDAKRQNAKAKWESMQRCVETSGIRRRARLAAMGSALSAIDPEKVLQRGYAVVMREGEALSSAEGVRAGDAIQIRMKDANLWAGVTAVSRKDKV